MLTGKKFCSPLGSKNAKKNLYLLTLGKIVLIPYYLGKIIYFFRSEPIICMPTTHLTTWIFGSKFEIIGSGHLGCDMVDIKDQNLKFHLPWCQAKPDDFTQYVSNTTRKYLEKAYNMNENKLIFHQNFEIFFLLNTWSTHFSAKKWK